MGFKLSDPNFIQHLEELVEQQMFDQFFEEVQSAMAESPAETVLDILGDRSKTSSKLKQLDNMIARLIKREEYEKITPLNEILNNVHAELAYENAMKACSQK